MPHPVALTEDVEVIERMYHEHGLTLSEIGSEYGVSYNAVYNYFDRNGIPTDRTKYRGGRQTEASYLMDNNGYERWECSYKNDTLSCQVHRLVAVAEHGFDTVAGNIVHHKNGVPWDNRPTNLEVMTQSEHATRHNLDRQEDGGWRDEDVLYNLYVERGLSTYKIADRLGCSAPTILDWLSKHGIKTRGR